MRTPIAAAAERVRGDLGRVDLVVANAARCWRAPFETVDTAEWDRKLDLDVRGLLHTGRAFAVAAPARVNIAELIVVPTAQG
jgi:NADP-dependent 3-hydroxy acid dehydrogenase YdfG